MARSCFSDYSKVLEEIRKALGRLTTSRPPPPLRRYLKWDAGSFGGNLSFQERFSYLNDEDGGIQIPCGFCKRFPISSFG